MSELTWQYVAGFFDGEGCIMSNTKANGRIVKRVVISQKEDEVLYKIKDFLKNYGINGNLYKGKSSGATNLDIRKMESVKLFLENVVDYLIVKKDKAREALKTDFSYKRKYFDNNNFSKVLELRKTGLTWGQIAIIYGVNKSTLQKRYTKYLKGTELLASQ